MKVSTDGVVIWEVKTGEADRVITILTPTGIVTAYARGSRRPGNKLTSATSMLSFSNFELYSGKNMYTVDDALIKERFLSVFSDVGKYSLAVYFCELLKHLAPVDDDAGEYVSLLLNSLYILGLETASILQVKAVFELRIMSISGYMPDLELCAGCGVVNSKLLFFDSLNGVWYCEDCSRGSGRSFNSTGAVLESMRYIINSEAGKIFSFSIPEKALETLNKLTSVFVLTHIEKPLATLEFLQKFL